jgi:RNA polymerase sigma-70 factor, ECF subfamily
VKESTARHTEGVMDLDLLRAGDAATIDAFYREYAPRVLGWTIRLGGPDLDPEDAAHEVFETALKRLSGFRGDSKLSTWLFAVTRRSLANQRRKAALRRMVGLGQIAEPADTLRTDEEVARLRRRRAVQHALERLNKNQREVLVLCDMEGHTAPEAALMLGVPAGTVYSRIHHARKAFAKAVTAEGLDLDEERRVLRLSRRTG